MPSETCDVWGCDGTPEREVSGFSDGRPLKICGGCIERFRSIFEEDEDDA